MKAPDKLPRFLVTGPCRPGDLVTLGPEQSRHMAAVLRTERGQHVRVFTGSGEEFVALVEKADPKASLVSIFRRCEITRQLGLELALGFAPPPGNRSDIIVEKATELGVTRLQPVICERVQEFQAAAAERRLARWQRKAEEATRQSQRSVVPVIHSPVKLADFVGAGDSALLLLASPGASQGLWQTLAKVEETPPSVAALVGPAGGFTRQELQAAADAGFVGVSLGPNVLRVETAAICLLSAVALRFDMGR